MPEKLTIWRCPDCGEQVSDELIQDPRTLQYKRGHYHDAPPGWWTEDGPGPENVKNHLRSSCPRAPWIWSPFTAMDGPE
jgi:hypothetical protein